MQGNANLSDVTEALGPPGGFSSCLDGWQQQRDQDADDGDYDQQLDQRKTYANTAIPMPRY